MKRLSSALSTPIQPPTSSGSSSESLEDSGSLRVEELVTECLYALDLGRSQRLRQLMTDHPDWPFSLSLASDAAPRQLATLIQAMSVDGHFPPVQLTGPADPNVRGAELAELLIQPGLHEVILTDLRLNEEQLEDMAQALQGRSSTLESLAWGDDTECLINASVATVVERLPSVRHLSLLQTSTDAANLSLVHDPARRLALTLANRPLDSLTLHDMGCLMHLLSTALPKGSPIPWKTVEIGHMDLSAAESDYIKPLALVLVRCLADPGMKALRLRDFHILFGMDSADGEATPSAVQCRDLISALAVAVRKRTQPLELTMDSDDLEACIVLMDGLTGDPDQAGLSADDSGSDSPEPITCVHHLQVAYRPELDDLKKLAVMDDALYTMVPWIRAYPRLETLDIRLEPHIEDPVSSTELMSVLSDDLLTALTEAIDHSHLTRLELQGSLLTPTPLFLQPCLTGVKRRALDRQLRIQSLDVSLQFLGRQYSVPAELCQQLAHDLVEAPVAPHPLSVLPVLNSQQLASHVARYNQLALSAAPEAPLVHPLTELSAQIDQRVGRSTPG